MQTDRQPSETAGTPRPTARISISASFTAEPIEPGLRLWARRLQRKFDIRFAPYNQLEQTLHDPSGEFATNAAGLNLMLVRIEDLGQFSTIDEPAIDMLRVNVRQLADSARQSAQGFPAPMLLIVCPPSQRFEQSAARGFSAEAAGELKAVLKDVANIHVAGWSDIDALYPVEEKSTEEGERLGRIPYTGLYFAALATFAVRHLDAITRPPYKVIAVDCDQTLWSGICGEDGPEHVRLLPPYHWLQQFLLEQRRSGMVLTMVSKNNEKDVFDTFAAHPEFPLKPSDFSAWRINWRPKEDNLAELALELNLGLDSFIFIDDNPKECAEVEDAIPESLTVPLPDPPGDIPSFLTRVWAFDHPVVTEEDRKRGDYYARNREFAQQARGTASLEEFIQKLGLAVHVTSLQSETLARAAQLTQRTNQFNTTTIRRTEAEIEQLARDPRWSAYTATVADRFGEYGVTALVITERNGGELRVDSFMLSCRVLGRGVEHRIMRFIGQTAFDLGLETVAVSLRESARNAPARQFIDSIPNARISKTPEGSVYRFAAQELGKLTWTPAPSAWQAYEAAPHPVSGRTFFDYVHIATELGSARQVLEAVRSEYSAASADGDGAAATEAEAKLAAIWAELLRREPVKTTDNFFDLGGHSLLAVLLLMRIREEFGVELSVDDVYSATLTLSELAGLIEARKLGDIGEREYAELLKELEGLSDEEVQALLEQAQAEE